MSRRFPVCNAKEVIKILRRHGFQLVAQSGSHQKWRHANGRQEIVAIKSSYLLSFLESVSEVSAKLKEPNTKEKKFEDVVREAEQAAVLVLVY